MDPKRSLIVMPGSLPDTWRVLALGLAGGSSLDWFASTSGQEGHDALERTISQSPPGANGVAFLPALSGEGTPFWRPRTRGAFVGLSLTSSKSDMTRAVLEGVAVELRLMVSALSTFGPAPSELSLAGGGSRSRSWCTIVADATALPVNRVVDPHPSLRGAACYGFAARGDFRSAVEASYVLASPLETFNPDPGLRQRYSDAAELQLLLRARLGDEILVHRLSPSDDDT
jgi:xylulokinase